ncbi:MAG TPA: S-adenosylmethionine decarboxylase [Gemmatimonadales bacterium]|nr:S-adenosylmethionine decarboxylase [Gemmatimonadales bacterium]
MSTHSRSALLVHTTADLHGIAGTQLRDSSLLSGLLIAASGAAGLSAVAAPAARQLPDEGIAAWMPLDSGWVAFRSFPDHELLVLDVVAPTTGETRKAVEVFARRLAARDVHTGSQPRG